MKKILIGLLAAVVLLVIAAVLTVTLLLDSAVKKGIETIGPRIAKVDIKLDGVSLSPWSGSGSLRGLIIGNPEGYKTPQAIRVGKASMGVSPGSLRSDKIVVRHVRLEAPEITLEGGLRQNNLTKILDNLNAATGGDGKTADTSKDAEPGKKLQVDEFLVTGAKVHVSLTGMGGKAVPVILPDIRLSNLGTGPEGITAAELTRLLLQAMTDEAVKAAGTIATDMGRGVIEDAGKTATESVEKATKGVTDLFKKNK